MRLHQNKAEQVHNLSDAHTHGVKAEGQNSGGSTSTFFLSPNKASLSCTVYVGHIISPFTHAARQTCRDARRRRTVKSFTPLICKQVYILCTEGVQCCNLGEQLRDESAVSTHVRRICVFVRAAFASTQTASFHIIN